MTTARFTIGSILGMVTSTANAGTSVISSVAKGADMLTAFVDKQAMEQEYRYKLEHKVFKENTRVELSDQLAQSSDTINKKKAKSEDYAKSFDHFYTLLSIDEE